MLIPLHLVPVPADEPPGFGDPGHAWQGDGGLKIALGLHLGDIRALGLTVAGATSAGVGSRELLRFGQLMNDAGLAINPTRMLYDRAYACERLVEALRRGSGELRDVAEEPLRRLPGGRGVDRPGQLGSADLSGPRCFPQAEACLSSLGRDRGRG